MLMLLRPFLEDDGSSARGLFGQERIVAANRSGRTAVAA